MKISKTHFRLYKGKYSGDWHSEIWADKFNWASMSGTFWFTIKIFTPKNIIKAFKYTKHQLENK